MDIVCLKIRPLRLRAFFQKELRMAKDLAKKYFFPFHLLAQMCLALAKAVAGLPGQPVGRRNVHGDTGLHTCDACCLTYDCNSRPCEQVVRGKLLIIMVSDIIGVRNQFIKC